MNAELDQLERDVEAARARLVVDMSRLGEQGGGDGVRDRLTSEVSGRKDALVSEATEGVLSNIQARIAANPGAALAIGAGLAWRLYRHPPVTTLLVGAGLVSLLRTDPEHPAAGAETAAGAVRLARSARSRVQEWRDSDPAGQVGEAVGSYREKAASVAAGTAGSVREVAGNVGEQVGDLATAVRSRAAEFAGTAQDQLGSARHSAANALRRAGRRADRWTATGQRAVARATSDLEVRDGYLLGAAAFAIAAAVGIAAQRRSAERLATPAVLRSRPDTQTRRPREVRLERHGPSGARFERSASAEPG